VRKAKSSELSVFSADNSYTYCDHDFPNDCPDGNEKDIYWAEMLEACKPLPVTNLPDQYGYEAFENVSIPNTHFTMLRVYNRCLLKFPNNMYFCIS